MSTHERQLNDLLVKCQYKYKDLTKRDLLSALSYFKELSPRIDKHVYPNGLSKDLVSLHGTIPVSFRSSVYNIPVQLYMSDSHPYEPPLVYVRPTPDMSINVSSTVDSSGRVYLPALTEWRYPTSDLYMLLNLMTIKFSEQTPLYTKVNKTANPSGAAHVSSMGAAPGTASTTNMTPYPLETYPARPPYPGGGAMPIPGYSGANSTPYPNTGMEPAMPPYPSMGQGFPINPYYPQPLSHLKSNSNSSLGQTRPFAASVATTSQYGVKSASSYADDTIKPEHYLMSLISAVHDRIRAKYKETYDDKMAEIESLRRVKSDLETSRKNLHSLLNDAENESLTITELTVELRGRTSQLNENLSRMKYRDKASIEDAVVTTMPLYRQLLQLFAEELAIQDLIFYLGEGLIHKTINLDNFLKQIRLLTRKQFFLRATMQKAREKAALPT